MVDVAIPQISRELHLKNEQVQATVGLPDDGATVPFIARYRKEATASLDEVAIISIRDRLSQLRALRGRREAILASLEERGLLTEELRMAVLSAESMATLEDMYLPYRPKRRTRATIAREKGLEPLALLLWDQEDFDVNAAAIEYVKPEIGVDGVADALAGARDIIAEWVSEDSTARGEIRALFWSQGSFSSKVVSGKNAEAAKYRDYFEWQEPVGDMPSHRVLAMLRGERESLLSIHIAPPVANAIAILDGMFVTGETDASQEVRLAVQDRYRPLLEASMETEVRKEARVRAEDAAIIVFAENLRELLLAPALGQKNILALDPGFRTGCKLVCLDRQGRLLYHDTVYPLLGGWGEQESRNKDRAIVPAIRCRSHRRGEWHRRPRDPSLSDESGVGITNFCRHGQRERGLDLFSPPRWRGLNSPMRTLRSGELFPSAAVSWTLWPSWSRSTPSPSAWGNTSTTLIKRP